jgi:hypothetical protein
MRCPWIPHAGKPGRMQAQGLVVCRPKAWSYAGPKAWLVPYELAAGELSARRHTGTFSPTGRL